MVPVFSGAGKKLAAEVENELSTEKLKKIPFRWQKDVDEYKAKHPEYNETISNEAAITNLVKDPVPNSDTSPVAEDKKTKDKNSKEGQW